MEPSHKPSRRATHSVRTPFGALPRTGEGPASPWAPEAEPSDAVPTAHTPQAPPGSPPSRRAIRPVDWPDPAEARAWLDVAYANATDLAALAREGSRRLKRRVLSRAELRRQTRELERTLLALF